MKSLVTKGCFAKGMKCFVKSCKRNHEYLTWCLRWICKRLVKVKSSVLLCMLHKMLIETSQSVQQYDWQRSHFIHQLSQVSVKTVDALGLKAN